MVLNKWEFFNLEKKRKASGFSLGKNGTYTDTMQVAIFPRQDKVVSLPMKDTQVSGLRNKHVVDGTKHEEKITRRGPGTGGKS